MNSKSMTIYISDYSTGHIMIQVKNRVVDGEFKSFFTTKLSKEHEVLTKN